MNNNVRKVTSENYPTDSGREGELIFRLVYKQAGCKKSFSRLWLSSMEESAIREGFAHLKPSTEYDALYNAALCRERADWMVGINASRLFSCLYGQPLAVGRVMTPVLAMTVVREAAIAAFVPEKFYTVALTLADGGTASSKRFVQKADAELLLSKCRKEGRVTVQKMERKEKSENPPPLYDLTALQRDTNRLLGFTAQQTLDYAQSLYEKRLITYPRTDSRFLTEDMAASLPGLVTDTGRAFAVEEPFPIHVQQVINGSKVTDHHALLPTKSMANADLAALPAGERNILRLIAARLLCAVGEPYCYAETTLTTICAGAEFTAKGKVVLSEGWKVVERKMLGELLGKQKEPAVLPDVQEQSQCSVAGAELKEGQTSPPKAYTEDTLLSAMQAAGADSMPEGVERQGIGTPATRAATIEKLVQKGFLERKGTKKTKVLLPTDKGKALITVMPEEIQSPEMTADWETKLLRIERGEMEPETLPKDIRLINSHYDDLYRIPNGGVIQVDYPDGRSFTARLEHLDDYHFDMGGLGNVFHICQFAEVMERNHADFYPEIQTQDEQAAWELGGKGYLAIQSCEDGWDYTLYHSDYSVMDGGQLDAPELTIQEVREEILEAHHMEKGRRLIQDYDFIMDRAAEAEELGLNSHPSTLEKLASLAGAKEKCDAPECSLVGCRKVRDAHEL